MHLFDIICKNAMEPADTTQLEMAYQWQSARIGRLSEWRAEI
jgi:hypothetical protein